MKWLPNGVCITSLIIEILGLHFHVSNSCNDLILWINCDSISYGDGVNLYLTKGDKKASP